MCVAGGSSFTASQQTALPLVYKVNRHVCAESTDCALKIVRVLILSYGLAAIIYTRDVEDFQIGEIR